MHQTLGMRWKTSEAEGDTLNVQCGPWCLQYPDRFRSHGGLLFMNSNLHFRMVHTWAWVSKSFRPITFSNRSKGPASLITTLANCLPGGNWSTVLSSSSPCTWSKVVVLLTQVHLIELIILVESSACLSTQPSFVYVWFQEHTRCFRNALSLLRIVLLFRRMFLASLPPSLLGSWKIDVPISYTMSSPISSIYRNGPVWACRWCIKSSSAASTVEHPSARVSKASRLIAAQTLFLHEWRQWIQGADKASSRTSRTRWTRLTLWALQRVYARAL